MLYLLVFCSCFLDAEVIVVDGRSYRLDGLSLGEGKNRPTRIRGNIFYHNFHGSLGNLPKNVTECKFDKLTNAVYYRKQPDGTNACFNVADLSTEEIKAKPNLEGLEFRYTSPSSTGSVTYHLYCHPLSNLIASVDDDFNFVLQWWGSQGCPLEDFEL
ncbi:hypothetical protein BLNAU_6245 [Blattamonas nauphoetae]|uniref:Uncharacterized protein n=1 Tax=Blattamonas nauphoetae TaxID=2049346 RepID=A0ABQ9Y4R6_9EUKA|nr:hypothetical protein BLNAU_6245 [Blattamonas nauphoetae]